LFAARSYSDHASPHAARNRASGALGEDQAMRVTGIVLAGGRSTRFGRDKLLEPIQGEPLVWRPMRALAAAADEVIVATAAGRSFPVPPDLATPVSFAVDERPDAGPVEGLRAALDQAPAPLALVVAGDMPSLATADLQRLVGAVATGARAASLGQPLPCAVNVGDARRVIAETEPRSLRALLTALGAVELQPLDPATLRDIDEAGDLPLA
jgi:molybdopterin-guanine dinucleotide biosynthesis protein A